MLGARILLIIGGGIAAYKSLDLIRRLRERGATVTPILTKSATQFVTPLSVSALAESKVYQDLFDLTDEAEMGHIQLSRMADLVVIAPATANILAKMAAGLADDLATTLVLATDKPVMVAPAMNVHMWEHPATQRNIHTLQNDGITVVGPATGTMACGEFGPGRMAEPADILEAVRRKIASGPLAGRHVIVTSGPTHEPIDPVRYIANRSSGAQGAAVAEALLALGADVTFITGPAEVPPPRGARVYSVETVEEMLKAVTGALPADVAVFAAAAADWRIANSGSSKIKKQAGRLPVLEFTENPDILATVAQMTSGRPKLVIGFAAETNDLLENATQKRLRKGCDWIVANDVSAHTGIMGGVDNQITLITSDKAEDWPRMDKRAVAVKLAQRIAETIG